MNRLEERLSNPVPSISSNRPVSMTQCNHLPSVAREAILIQCRAFMPLLAPGAQNIGTPQR